MSLGNVQAGIYRVQCTPTVADSYISAIRQGDRDVLKQGLQIDGNGENNSWTVMFTPAAGTLEGKVLDPKGKANGALIALVPDDPGAKYLYRTVMADQNGGFTIRTVAPGSYHLFAWTELDGAAYRNADFMKQYEEKGTAIKIGSAEKKTGVVTNLLD
jgi:hypothetical protein